MVYVAISRDNQRTPIEQTGADRRAALLEIRRAARTWRRGGDRRRRSRASAREPARPPGRRVLGAAVRERLHALSARGRPHGLDAHGSVGRAELEAVAGKPVRRADARCTDRSRVADADHARRRQGDSADRGSRGHRARQAHQDSEPDSHEVVGPSDLSRRHGAPAERLRRASGRPLPGQLRAKDTSRSRAPGGFGRGGPLREALARGRHAALHLRHAPASVAVLRRFVRRELREQRPVRRRDHAGADPRGRNEVPRDPGAVGADALRRIDRRLDCRSPTRSSTRISTAGRSRAAPTPSISRITRSSTSTAIPTPISSTWAG